MKQEFIEFLESLMNAAPEVVKEKMTDGNGTHITEYLLMEGFDLSKMLDIA